MSRLARKNRTSEELGIKSSGGLNDLLDNQTKGVFRIDDDEYNYILENMTDKEMDLFVQNKLTFADKRQLLIMVEGYISNYNKTLE